MWHVLSSEDWSTLTMFFFDPVTMELHFMVSQIV